MYKRIIVGADPTHTEESPTALAVAAAHLEPGGELVVVTIVRAGDADFFPHIPEEPPGAMEERARTGLEEMIERELPHGISVRSRILHGLAGPALVETAREEGAELIVLTAHEGGGLLSLHPDTLQHVCSHAPCPILVLPPAGGAGAA